MTTWRLMDGVAGRPGIGSSKTQPPATATPLTGDYIAGTTFSVSLAGLWLKGIWWYCCASGQATAPVPVALWQVTSATTGVFVPGTSATSGPQTPGAWTFIPFTAPVPLSLGTPYLAAVAQNGSFPDTENQFAATQPYALGITNGPVTAYADSNSGGGPPTIGYFFPQGAFSVSGSDPATTFPDTGNASDLLWVDVEVTDQAPAGFSGSCRLWPNKFDSSPSTGLDTNLPFTLATEVRLSAPVTSNRIWFYSYAGSGSLPTWAGVYPAAGGAAVIANPAPSWLTPAGGAAVAGGGWCRCTLSGAAPAGHYRAAVYNAGGAAAAWSSREYEYFSAGAGAAGISGFGPVSSPASAAAANAYVYTSNPAAVPPYAQGTIEPANGAFARDDSAISGAPQFPYLCADYTIDAGTPAGAIAETFWVDWEVTPAAGSASGLLTVTYAAGGF